MITSFDALLVSLWGAVTALGVRRGLGGAVWGALGVGVCFLVNLYAPGSLWALGLALLLGVGALVAARRLVPEPLTHPWHLLAGGLGGFALGAVLVGSLALGLPIQTVGDLRRYPSSELPEVLYYPVFNSSIRQELNALWRPGASPALRTLLLPDQQRAAR